MPGIIQARDPKIEWRELTQADVEWSRLMIAQALRGALPYGYHDTTAQSAWGNVVNQAIIRGEIAIGATVNGGALCGLLIARAAVDAPGAGALVVECNVSMFGDELPAQMLAVARDLAQRSGVLLAQRRVVPAIVEYLPA